jgi:hypothetical protein
MFWAWNDVWRKPESDHRLDRVRSGIRKGMIVAFSDRSSNLDKEFPEAETRPILADGRKHFNLGDSSVARTAEGIWRKLAIAVAISECPTARRDWIAERLKSTSYVSQRVRQDRLRPDGERLKRKRKREKKWRKL